MQSAAVFRSRSIAASLLSIALAVGLVSGQETAKRPSAATFYESAKLALVEVLVNGHLDGTAWFADPKGLLVTAAHVLGRPGQNIEITSPRIGRLKATVAAVDLGHDVALLRVSPRAGGFPAMKLAEKAPSPGEDVFLLGTPIYRHDVLVGGVMAHGGTAYESYGERYVENVHIAATVPGGMSGGPWLSTAGEAFGVQSGVMSQNAIPVGIAFASPLEAVRTLLRQSRSASTPTSGAAFEELWQQDRKTLDRYPPQAEGLVVRRLQDDGPAARAGLKLWDLVIAADGKKVRLTEELLRAVCGKRPGDSIDLTLLRPDGAGEQKVTIRLGKLEVGWP